MSILSNGNVGIGTTSPGHPLVVVTPTGDKGISLTNSGGTELIHMRQDAGDAAAIGLKDGGAVKIWLSSRADNNSYFNTGANVGIGTSAPTGKLHVNGKTLITRTGNGVGFELQATSSSCSKRILSKHHQRQADVNYYKLLIPQAYDGNNKSGGHIKLTVNWMGNHASNAYTKVVECTYGTSHGRPDDGYLDISPFAVTHESNSALSYGPYAVTPTLTLYRGVAEDGSGYCGLIIKVSGYHASYNRDIYIEAEVTGFLEAEPSLTHFGTSNEAGALALNAVTYIGGHAGGGQGGGTIIGGDATVTGTLTESSSIAIKENIFDFNTTLDKINRVRPVRFNKKKTKDKKEIGLIAEELAEIFPELVENDENGNPASVNYTRAVTVLFDGFKQMYKELKEIKEKIK